MIQNAPSADRAGVDFGSVDSAPKRFSHPVALWRAPAMLLVFCLLAASQLWLMSLPGVQDVFPLRDYIWADYGGRAILSMRIFILSFYVAFCLFAAGSFKGRMLMMIDLIIRFALVCALFDLANGLLASTTALRLPANGMEIVAGLFGFAIFAFKMLERGVMPKHLSIRHKRFRFGYGMFRIGAACLIAALVSIIIARQDFWLVEGMRNIALLGGLGPGVFLFLPLFFLILYAIGRIEQAQSIREDFAPDVTVIVPAHNEAYIIGRTIRSIDRAAACYDGNVAIVILDNASTDDTGIIAAETLKDCSNLQGRVIPVETPGKAYALNRGLAESSTEFVVRIDADTVVREDNLKLAMQNFADPSVAIVGGIPIPPGGGMFDRVRMIEVLLKHGFYSVALGAVEGLVGIPGMFVVYRTEHPRLLGGFARGINGEDTDMSLRIAEMGYRSVVDPRVQFVSEVPATYGHMREQRLRWFRSVYHISSRSYRLIDSSWLTLRGKLVLPYMLVNSARRAMMIPLILFGILQFFILSIDAGAEFVRGIIAVLIGAPALMALIACLLNGRLVAALFLPEYLFFRAIRAYYTLESTMTILISRSLDNQVDPDTVKRNNPFREYLDTLPPSQLRNEDRLGTGTARLNSFLAVLLTGFLSLAFVGMQDAAAQSSVTFEQDAAIARQVAPPDIIESGLEQDRLQTSIDLGSYLRYDRGTDNPLLLRGGFILSRYPDAKELDRYGFEGDAQYEMRLGEEEKWRLRFEGQYRHVNDRDGHVFSQRRVGTLLGYRHSASHASRIRLLLTDRDQDEENTFDGFDQTQFRFEAGHAWRPRRDRLYLLGTLFAETADADDDRFSYEALGVWGFARFPLSQRLDLITRMTVYRREYDGSFSETFTQARVDERFWPRVGMEYRLRDRLTAFGEVGYDVNQSNVPVRDYEGVTAIIGVRLAEPLIGDDLDN